MKATYSSCKHKESDKFPSIVPRVNSCDLPHHSSQRQRSVTKPLAGSALEHVLGTCAQLRFGGASQGEFCFGLEQQETSLQQNFDCTWLSIGFSWHYTRTEGSTTESSYRVATDLEGWSRIKLPR
ncbi:uncharacterized protein LOC131322227 [Rhododendron vialii]|uniref:uncharacterized protein LOC131322227 n=1 Tax=Rhododendron vialii TaxID=182163 RepID=UPI00265DEAA3|nr:uncharacterized protein LOC131322227 [Rhododendron vialii]